MAFQHLPSLDRAFRKPLHDSTSPGVQTIRNTDGSETLSKTSDLTLSTERSPLPISGNIVQKMKRLVAELARLLRDESEEKRNLKLCTRKWKRRTESRELIPHVAGSLQRAPAGPNGRGKPRRSQRKKPHNTRQLRVSAHCKSADAQPAHRLTYKEPPTLPNPTTSSQLA